MRPLERDHLVQACCLALVVRWVRPLRWDHRLRAWCLARLRALVVRWVRPLRWDHRLQAWCLARLRALVVRWVRPGLAGEYIEGLQRLALAPGRFRKQG